MRNSLVRLTPLLALTAVPLVFGLGCGGSSTTLVPSDAGSDAATLADSGAVDSGSLSVTDSGAGSDSGNPPSGGGGADAGDAGSKALLVNKVDLLFMIDNSASMGDKQAYLGAAIPELVTRLVTPDCLDATGAVAGTSVADGSGNVSCPAGQTLEFPAVHDMHIGIVSSSLGTRLGDKVGSGSGGVCLPSATISVGGVVLSNHNDDQAHLLTRSSTPGASPPSETSLGDAASGFLAWFPPSKTNAGQSATPGAVPITTLPQLTTDFTDLVAGVHEYGCGIESQLESWYRFLIQPDPYASLDIDGAGHAEWVGVDTTILKQRHDFLRPDSLVAVVDLTDENDSEIDVRSLGGQGYLFMSAAFQPPHGTSACATNPADPACTFCPPSSSADGGASDGGDAGDPACAAGPYTAPTDWGFDMNLRHVHMQAKYGLNPQFPISRYVTGLTSRTVPDRAGEYPAGASSYVGMNNCTNPLFAASLPDGTSTDAATLCNLSAGTRSPSLVYYLHIGGVPHQLLHFDPASPASSALTAADWVKILGNDPLAYDYTGIDPHMIESYQPRSGLPDPSSANDADPISGREWITNVGPHLDLNVDREYACIFPLAAPRDCTNADNRLTCDCSSTGLTPQETSPLCDTTTPTNQLAAKAYPTVRELLLAKLLGTQAIVASICPIDVVDSASGNDPLYGYRPAVTGLVSHIKASLTQTVP